MILLGAGACGARESSREEAQALLERIARLTATADLGSRDAELSALASAPIASAELRALRDACIAAHRGQLEAERAQAEVRAALDAEPKPEPSALPTLQAKLDGATRALQRARPALASCEAQTRQATLKYR